MSSHKHRDQGAGGVPGKRLANIGSMTSKDDPVRDAKKKVKTDCAADVETEEAVLEKMRKTDR